MTVALADLGAGRADPADPARRMAVVRDLLVRDALVPYLGPGLLALTDSALPSTPEAVAAALHAKAPAPSRIRTNMWAVAQFIESRRHRKTLQAFMADIFAAPAPPSPLVRFLAGLPSRLVVNSWYDDQFAAALKAAGRDDFVEIQGITRAGINYDAWTLSYDAAGRPCDGAAIEAARTVLYSPHGGVRPAQNFLVADSDYVEVMTEIDIQTPIPTAVKEARTDRGFLFLGCRFHDQMLRTYARQIMKRSKGPHFAVADTAAMTRNERKFFADQMIEVIDAPLAEAAQMILS
ncbi:SIR2-like protein [Roseiarcus fermentans]|uniref:SIR2-like protein n=1 Tax=Roseiarcus fermentans TaxID=1473586 RepID=A0A366EP25_9HYPH|nr:SIR2 family protein [Roseiarcus fermentans]RBP04141.1 SIR2-like protein [Roseiarcus fermentans]